MTPRCSAFPGKSRALATAGRWLHRVMTCRRWGWGPGCGGQGIQGACVTEARSLPTWHQGSRPRSGDLSAGHTLSSGDPASGEMGCWVGPHQPPSLRPLWLPPNPPFLVPGAQHMLGGGRSKGECVRRPASPSKRRRGLEVGIVGSRGRRLGTDGRPTPLNSVIRRRGTYVTFCAFSYPSRKWE